MRAGGDPESRARLTSTARLPRIKFAPKRRADSGLTVTGLPSCAAFMQGTLSPRQGNMRTKVAVIAATAITLTGLAIPVASATVRSAAAER